MTTRIITSTELAAVCGGAELEPIDNTAETPWLVGAAVTGGTVAGYLGEKGARAISDGLGLHRSGSQSAGPRAWKVYKGIATAAFVSGAYWAGRFFDKAYNQR